MVVVAMKRPVSVTGLLTVMMAGVMAVASCGGSESPAPDPTSGPPSAVPSASPAPAPESTGGGAVPSPAGGDDTGSWATGPVTVTHEVTSTSQLTGIRTAAHPDEGYDRIVFDLAGEIPGYTVQYVDEVRQDGSGDLVEVPGRRYLLIRFNPAQAHTDAGEPLVSPRGRTLDHPMMRGYVLVGDFEGYVSVAIGLDDVVGFRVGELPGDPARVYIDVAA